jgi:hypothetical protein
MVCVHLLRRAEAGWRMLFKAALVPEESRQSDDMGNECL